MNWWIFDQEIKDLSNKINYKPDVIVGIARGGIVPAVAISNYLNVQEMLVFKVLRMGKERKIFGQATTDLKGKQVLIVDDMLETGRGCLAIKKYLESKGAIVKIACLYIMPETRVQITPNFFLKEVNQVMEFPWEQTLTYQNDCVR